MPTALAVLIDAENIPATLFGPLEREVKKLGEPVVWQLFGDFLAQAKPQWQALAQRKGIEIRQQFHGGKNAADIAMTVQAMDMLHAGRVEGFCLVSSDRDFTALACRLRADNRPVYGFGEAKAAQSFRAACSGFIVLKEPTAKAAPKAAPAAPLHLAAAEERGIDKSGVEILRRLLQTLCTEKGNRPVPVQTAAAFLRASEPRLAQRLGGTGKFLKSLKALELVDIHIEGSQQTISARLAA